MSQLKDYLGDGVYADFDGFQITLTTENGIDVTNTIVLEPEVMAALKNYEVRVIRRSEHEIARELKDKIAARIRGDDSDIALLFDAINEALNYLQAGAPGKALEVLDAAKSSLSHERGAD